MQSGRSYMKDSEDFLKKIRILGSFLENTILVIPDVVGFCSSIPYEVKLHALEVALENKPSTCGLT